VAGDVQRIRAARDEQRRRVALREVEPGQAQGFVVPYERDGAVAYRGVGGTDYACGGCGRLLAVGVHPGMFQGFVFACGCGALNQLAP
jgi:hypothetical protein